MSSTSPTQAETKQVEAALTISPEDRQSAARRTLAALVTELLFVLLPFAVLLLVNIYKDTSLFLLLKAPEWAFAATILFGQTLTKLITGITDLPGQDHLISENIGLAATVLVIAGIVPSMVVLTMLLLAPTPPNWLSGTQIVLFVISVLVFLVIGGAVQSKAMEHKLLERKRRRSKQPRDA